MIKLSQVIRWIFVLCGAQFFMNWILLTNPISKNPIIKLIYGWNKKAYCGFKYTERLQSAYFLGLVHIFAVVIMTFNGDFFTIVNLFTNIYPIIVQLYIGWRCWRIQKLRQL